MDAVLLGEVTSYREVPVEINPDGRARTIQVVITARARLERTHDQKIIWASNNFMFRQAYPLGVEAEAFVQLDNVALDVVAADFAEAVVTSILEGF